MTQTLKTSFLPSTPLGLLLAASLLGPFADQRAHPEPLPPVQSSGAVEYLSGGVGEEEAQAMQQAGAQWPMQLQFLINAKPRPEYAASVEVQVKDAKGMDVLQTATDGPFMLIKLAPGSYAVYATLDGKTLHKRISVGRNGQARAVFVWPMGTDAG